MRSGKRSHSVVLPSMSVNRKVLSITTHVHMCYRQEAGILQLELRHPPGALVFGSSAGTDGGQAIIRGKEVESRNPIQPSFAKSVFADGDLSIGQDQENARNILHAERSRNRVGIFVDEHIKSKAVLLDEMPGISSIVLRY